MYTLLFKVRDVPKGAKNNPEEQQEFSMPFCSQCGSSNPEGTRFCPACGAPISTANSSPGARPHGMSPPPPGSDSQAGWGSPGAQPPTQAKYRNPIVAAAWGFLWGFGAQAFYNGQPMKAIAQIAANFFIMWGFVFRTLPPDSAWPVGLAVAGLFMYDGYKVALRINNGEEVGPWTCF